MRLCQGRIIGSLRIFGRQISAGAVQLSQHLPLLHLAANRHIHAFHRGALHQRDHIHAFCGRNRAHIGALQLNAAPAHILHLHRNGRVHHRFRFCAAAGRKPCCQQSAAAQRRRHTLDVCFHIFFPFEIISFFFPSISRFYHKVFLLVSYCNELIRQPIQSKFYILFRFVYCIFRRPCFRAQPSSLFRQFLPHAVPAAAFPAGSFAHQ